MRNDFYQDNKLLINMAYNKNAVSYSNLVMLSVCSNVNLLSSAVASMQLVFATSFAANPSSIW
jgi:hypothetical protein